MIINEHTVTDSCLQFYHACCDSNAPSELTEALSGDCADITDMETWGITSDEWYTAVTGARTWLIEYNDD